MRLKISINLPWPIATLVVALLGALLSGIAVLNYYSYKRINAFEQANQMSIQETQRRSKVQEAKAEAMQAQVTELTKAGVALSSNNLKTEQINEQIQSLRNSIASQTIVGEDTNITSGDMGPYLTGSVQIICVNAKGVGSTGSGTLWKFKEVPYGVLTNYHVVKDQKTCVASITNSQNKPVGSFALEGSVYTFNANTDTAIVALGTSLADDNAPKESYNYSLSSLRKCPTTLPVGTPTVLIGFPTFAKRDAKITIPKFGTLDETYRSATNGIISGYDTSHTSPHGDLPHQNFFVSAKIDAGNSGGIALAKDNKGVCLLGLPTWLSMGTYENQGLVQNIANIIP